MKRWIVVCLLALSAGLNLWFLWPRSPAPAGADVTAPEKRGPSLPSIEIDFEGTPLADDTWKLDAEDALAALRDAPLEWRDRPPPPNVLMTWARDGAKRAGGLRSINLPRSPRMESELHPLRHAEPRALKLQRAINETTSKSLF